MDKMVKDEAQGMTRREFLAAGVMAGAAAVPGIARAEVFAPQVAPTAVDLLIVGPDVW